MPKRAVPDTHSVGVIPRDGEGLLVEHPLERGRPQYLETWVRGSIPLPGITSPPPRTEHHPHSPTDTSYPLQETSNPSGLTVLQDRAHPACFHGAVSIFMCEEESDEAGKQPPMQISAITIIKHPAP